MKMSVRRIVLLILSIIIIGFGLYSVISTLVQIPSLREEVLIIFSDPQFEAVFSDPEKIVDIILGASIAISCLVSVLFFLPAIFGLLHAFKKYKGGAHVVIAWIYLVFACLGILINIIGFIKASQFDWTFILSVCEVAVIIAFIVVAKQIKEEED